MDSMIKMLGGALTPQIMGSLANLTGESQAGTKSVATSAISALVGALSQKGDSEGGAQGILDMLNQPQNGLNVDDIAGDFAGILGDSGRRDSLAGAGDGILSALLPGGKMNGVLDLITGAAGVKRGSSSMMMKMLAPLAMGMLRRYVMSKGLGALGLSKFLGGQREFVQQATPGLGSVLGFGADPVEHTTRGTETTDRRATVKTPEPKKSGGLPGWLLPLFGLLLLGLLAWWFIGNRSDDADMAVNEPTFCGELSSLSKGVNDLPLAEEAGFVDAFDGLGETFDNVTDIAQNNDIPVDLLDSAWDVLKEVAGTGVVADIENGIDDVLGATDALTTGQSCPIN